MDKGKNEDENRIGESVTQAGAKEIFLLDSPRLHFSSRIRFSISPFIHLSFSLFILVLFPLLETT
jgi:hypothetical protein